jgi:hypothetical protein|mmetsp:Transcript_29628/g.47718  ORF Transcript_29628/g.47718 Transcript_29628/m.47718 type:complete len:366 (-) Transcript_29628:216-1313(-)|eukprot:CAMPEP_0169160818 /NCGR_PEP_ID=MMETSP1015-20121227/56686_1 /TAXON_ID=342587 /ORGANISM="Karlodinium micrum, Strain CCMP2283" /LENGTH=365 /DNA_ID=CAMNT_0009232577 /DNA_START=69 /DNA_END=1166 /DNA_ORIENTATION=+
MASSTAQIAKVLNDSEYNAGDPATAKMFLQALPHIFGGERHDFQVRLATMLRDALKQAREKQTGKQTSAITSIDEMNATLEKLQQEKNDAAAEAANAKSIVEEKAATLAEKKQSTATATQRHEETVRGNALVAKEHAEIEQAKGEIDALITGYLSMLVNGSWDTDEARDDFVKPVMDYLEEMGCDKVLLAALPKAFGRHPDKRGEFSKLSVDEAVKHLNEKAASIASRLEASKVKFEEAKAEDLGAWAIADVARDAEKEAENAKNIAEETSKQATVSDKVALSNVDDMQMKIEGAKAELEIIETKLGDIDAAVGAMDKLETEVVEEVTKENNDVAASPAAKRMKLAECETTSAMQEEIVAAVGGQ